MSNNPTVHFEFEGSIGRTQISYQNGDSEQLILTDAGPELYRLEESSLAGDAVYGDIIRATTTPDGALMFVEIAERSPLTTQSWMLSKELLESERIRTILSTVMKTGGMWEQVFGGMLIVHTPPDIALAIFDEITVASKSDPGRDRTQKIL